MAVQEFCFGPDVSPTSEEELCVATLNDFQAVLDIERNGYNGLDYLPTTYEFLVQGPGVCGYIYKIGGKVVGFLSVSLVDGGQTLMTNAARVHVAWRNKKVYSRFQEKVYSRFQEKVYSRFQEKVYSRFQEKVYSRFQEKVYSRFQEKVYSRFQEKVYSRFQEKVYSRFQEKVYSRFQEKVLEQYQGVPGVKYNAFLTDNTNMEANGHKILRTYKLIENKIITITECNVATLRKKALEMAVTNISGLREMTLDELHHLMTTDPGNVDHLFPQGRIILEWKTFRLMAANYTLILQGFNKTNKRIFLSSGPKCTSVENEVENLPKLFSAASYTDCRKGFVNSMDIFGAGSPEELMAHVEWNLRFIADVVSTENVVLMIFYSRSIGDVIEELKQKYPLKDSALPYTTESLFERELY